MGNHGKNINTKEVVDLYNVGMNQSQIAKRFNCDPSAITYHLKKSGTKIINPFAQFTNKKIEQIISIYKSGKTIKETAEESGCCYNAVWKYLSKSKLCGRTQTFYKGKNKFKRNSQRLVCGKYWLIFKPDCPYSKKTGYVFEHRFIMAEKLGRPLNKDEVVHHINGDGFDNRVENLVVLTRKSHSETHSEIRDFINKNGTKPCGKCKEVKPLSEYRKIKRSPFFFSYCKNCVNH